MANEMVRVLSKDGTVTTVDLRKPQEHISPKHSGEAPEFTQLIRRLVVTNKPIIINE